VATLHWTAPPNNGAAITGYTIRVKVDGVFLPPHVFASTASTQIQGGLTPGKTYSFTVAARNSRGTGPYSAATAGLKAT
jgi:hypothetical protein